LTNFPNKNPVPIQCLFPSGLTIPIATTQSRKNGGINAIVLFFCLVFQLTANGLGMCRAEV
jgi:hypothetical protein